MLRTESLTVVLQRIHNHLPQPATQAHTPSINTTAEVNYMEKKSSIVKYFATTARWGSGPAGFISTCPQTEEKDHPASLEEMCCQHIKWFLDWNHCYKSAATKIPHNAGLILSHKLAENLSPTGDQISAASCIQVQSSCFTLNDHGK